MKTSVFGLSLLMGVASANILFTWVEPKCNHTDPITSQHCLTGQHCSQNNM